MTTPAYDVFIAAPMSALGEAGYAQGRASVLDIITQCSARGFGPIYFAGAEIGGTESFTDEAEALRRDLSALKNAKLFVLIYPSKLVTSALIEVGYALALKLPSLLLVRDRADLPYLLNQAEKAGAGDLLPRLKIAPLGGADESAAAIAAFRDELIGQGHG